MYCRQRVDITRRSTEQCAVDVTIIPLDAVSVRDTIPLHWLSICISVGNFYGGEQICHNYWFITDSRSRNFRITSEDWTVHLSSHAHIKTLRLHSLPPPLRFYSILFQLFWIRLLSSADTSMHCRKRSTDLSSLSDSLIRYLLVVSNPKVKMGEQTIITSFPRFY